MRLLKSLKSLYREMRSSCFSPEWIQIDGKLHSVKRRFNSVARLPADTKITTWLNSRASRRSLNFFVLLLFVELDVILHESMKRELRLIINEDLHGILAELPADRANGCAECG